MAVQEGGLKFWVNLTDYIDTGLFLDHRITRSLVREAAHDKRVLNLFGYTGSFSVYAAAGSARDTTTVDLSPTYLEWSRRNLELNGVRAANHRLIRQDVMTFVRDLTPDIVFDLAVVDAPTYSNSKRTTHDWNLQRDHVALLTQLQEHLAPGGLIFFATNFRQFKLHHEQLPELSIREISRQTVPPDFRNRRIHRCWKLLTPS